MSVQPPLFLTATLVALSAAVAVVSAQLAVPYPTKSATVTAVGQPVVVVATVVPRTNATLPLVADISIDVFVTSDVKVVPTAAVLASFIRKY